MSVSKSDLVAGFNLMQAVVEVLAAHGGWVPSGVVYAAMQGRVGLAAYSRMLRVLEDGEVITRDGDLMRVSVAIAEAFQANRARREAEAVAMEGGCSVVNPAAFNASVW